MTNKKRLLVTLAVAVALLVVAIKAVAAYLIEVYGIRALVTDAASERLRRPVTLAAVSVVVLPLPAIELRDLEVAEDQKFGKEALLHIARIQLRPRFSSLFRGRVELGHVVFHKPRLMLTRNGDGQWNVSSLLSDRQGRGPVAPVGVIETATATVAMTTPLHLAIENGAVTYVTRGTDGATSRRTLEGLELMLRTHERVVAFKGWTRIGRGDLRISLDGTISFNGPGGILNAPVQARLAFTANNIAGITAAVLRPSPIIGGSLEGALAVGGALGRPSVSGDVELAHVTILQTKRYCSEPRSPTLVLPVVKAHVEWSGDRFTARPVTAELGDGTVIMEMRATHNRGWNADVTALTAKGLPLDIVLVDFLCHGYAVTGLLNLTGDIALHRAANGIAMSGNGRLRISSGKVVGSQGLGIISDVVRLGGFVANSPFAFDSIAADYRLTSGAVTIHNLLVTSRNMKIAAWGGYRLGKGHWDLTVVAEQGNQVVKAKMQGTAASPAVLALR